jgi:MFS family permease
MRLWSVANVISNIGTWMQMVAQNLLVMHLTGSVGMAGLSLSAQAAPGLLFGVAGGAAVDKWPRKLTAAAGQVALAAVAFTTAVLAGFGLLTVPVLLILGAVSGIVATVDGPACSLLGNELVPADDVPSAIALGSVVTSVGRLTGTALAGAAVAGIGIPAAYAANGLSFLAVAACLPFLRPAKNRAAAPASAPRAEQERGGVRAGLRYLRGNRSLLALAGIGALTSVLGRNYSLSMAALVTGPMHLGPGAYGSVGVALAVGGIAGAVFAARMRNPRVWTVLALAAAAAALQICAGLSPVLLALLVLAVPLAAAEAASDTTTATLLQTIPPSGMRGRVLGAWRTASTTWGLAGPAALGLLLQAAGPRIGLVIGGLVLLAVSAAALGLARLRGLSPPLPGRSFGPLPARA